LPITLPKSVSNPQKPTKTGPGTPYFCWIWAKVPAFFFSKLDPTERRLPLTMRSENCRKVWANTDWPRSLAITAGS
jgi:hypothetical protein